MLLLFLLCMITFIVSSGIAVIAIVFQRELAQFFLLALLLGLSLSLRLGMTTDQTEKIVANQGIVAQAL